MRILIITSDESGEILRPIIADTHVHTLACGHAYSTIMENVHWAAQKGLSFIGITEHAPEMHDAPQSSFFRNLYSLPDRIEGVNILKGAECNIMDYDGRLDLSEKLLRELDWVIASYHNPICLPGTLEQNTLGWLRIAENPDVDVIGHCGDGRYAFELEKVIKKFKEYEKIVEINAHSFVVRPGSDINCREIARCCAKYQVPVVVSSDAHFCMDVGNVMASVQMLEEIGFPEELVLNADHDRFLEVVRKKTNRF